MSRGRGMRALLAGIVLGIAAVAQAGEPATLKAGAFEPPGPAPAFALAGSHGKPVALADYRGKVVLLEFGFTNCRAVCPVTLSTLKLAMHQLGAQASGVQVVFVTVDPQRDDAAQLARYLAAFDASFVGATGTESELAAVRRDYGVAAQAVAGGIAHSSSVYLIDPRGRLRGLMPYGRGADDYVHDVRVLLASP